MTEAFERIKHGLDEAVKVAQGDPATIANIKVTPSCGLGCGCVFCDLKCSLFYDEDSEYFYHDGAEGTRIRCDVSNTMGERVTRSELLEFAKSGGPIIGDET